MDRRKPTTTQDSFSGVLSVCVEELECELRSIGCVPWSPFILNPRRLRGSDFLMRWSQGNWSEGILMDAVNNSSDYFAIPYGPSGTAPKDDIREFELYFQRLDQAGHGDVKRPDLLVFNKSSKQKVGAAVENIGGTEELPFTHEDEGVMEEILGEAILAVESENSLWEVRKMKNYGDPLRPMRRLGGKPGLPKNAVLPTVIVKEEDRVPLRDWQNRSSVPIHIWHVFYDLAFGLSLDEAENLVNGGLIQPTEQTFQAPGGATTTKVIYKYYYHYAYPLGEITVEPTPLADFVTDKNGHILPYVKFEGGKLELDGEALDILAQSGSVSRE